jgi:hypothetical protein
MREDRIYHRIESIFRKIFKEYPDNAISIIDPDTDESIATVSGYDIKHDTVKIKFPEYGDDFRCHILHPGGIENPHTVSIPVLSRSLFDCKNTYIDILGDDELKKNFFPLKYLMYCTKYKYLHGMENYLAVTVSDDCYDAYDVMPQDCIIYNYLCKIQQENKCDNISYDIYRIAAALDYNISHSSQNAIILISSYDKDSMLVTPISSSNLYSVTMSGWNENEDQILSMINNDHYTHEAKGYLYDIALVIEKFDFYAILDLD